MSASPFELEPYRRNVPDEAFLEDMKKVAHQLQKTSVTIEEYNKYGIFHAYFNKRHYAQTNKTQRWCAGLYPWRT